MRALEMAQSIPWAIRPEALEAILALAAREDISREVVSAAMHYHTEAVAAKVGPKLDGASTVTVRNGVAILPVEGPIVRYASLFADVSGATSVETLSTDLTQALSDPAVTAILLHIDSPGGEVSGIAEFADRLYAARDQKPITAYVSDLGASAGYWLASAASRIVVAETAALGSIGVVMAVPDPGAKKSKDIEFVSSVSPNKRADPGTESGKAQYQAIVNALGDVFVGAVARNRGVSAATVESDFGQGGILIGQQAVDAGLADRVGSFEQTLRDLADQQLALSERSKSNGPALPAPTPLRPSGPGRKTAVSMRDKFNAWLDGVDVSASADQEVAIVTANLNPPQPAPAAPAVAVQTTAAAADTETARMQAELASYRAENQRLRIAAITTAAASFATEMIRDGRAMPSEQAAIVDAFTQASIDDGVIGAVSFADGRTTSRVEIVKRQYQDRQSVRALFSEAVGDDVLMALHNRQAAPKKGDEVPTGDEVTRLIGMTAFGQSVIDARNGSSKN